VGDPVETVGWLAGLGNDELLAAIAFGLFIGICVVGRYTARAIKEKDEINERRVQEAIAGRKELRDSIHELANATQTFRSLEHLQRLNQR
jgi:uncharacterized protein YneF (UPF0154 family)